MVSPSVYEKYMIWLIWWSYWFYSNTSSTASPAICQLLASHDIGFRWIEACIEEELPLTTELEENLQNGVILAKLGHFFAPKIVPLRRIYDKDLTRFKVGWTYPAFPLKRFIIRYQLRQSMMTCLFFYWGGQEGKKARGWEGERTRVEILNSALGL